MKLFNTLTRNVEEFVPNVEGKVNMYTCGPTVYHFAHIGNLRSYIMEDVLEKTLRYAGYDVKRVMNITDVGHLSSDADTGEDKMLKGAKRENKTVMDIAKFYTDAFFADCAKLNIKTPDVVEPATNCIDSFIEMIEKLLEKGYAYQAGENIYFDTSKLQNYYVFGNQNEEELMVGVRDDVEQDENKKNKSDFVLWFTKSKFDDQELKWDSPWGGSTLTARSPFNTSTALAFRWSSPFAKPPLWAIHFFTLDTSPCEGTKRVHTVVSGCCSNSSKTLSFFPLAMTTSIPSSATLRAMVVLVNIPPRPKPDFSVWI